MPSKASKPAKAKPKTKSRSQGLTPKVRQHQRVPNTVTNSNDSVIEERNPLFLDKPTNLQRKQDTLDGNVMLSKSVTNQEFGECAKHGTPLPRNAVTAIGWSQPYPTDDGHHQLTDERGTFQHIESTSTTFKNTSKNSLDVEFSVPLSRTGHPNVVNLRHDYGPKNLLPGQETTVHFDYKKLLKANNYQYEPYRFSRQDESGVVSWYTKNMVFIVKVSDVNQQTGEAWDFSVDEELLQVKHVVTYIVDEVTTVDQVAVHRSSFVVNASKDETQLMEITPIRNILGKHITYKGETTVLSVNVPRVYCQVVGSSASPDYIILTQYGKESWKPPQYYESGGNENIGGFGIFVNLPNFWIPDPSIKQYFGTTVAKYMYNKKVKEWMLYIQAAGEDPDTKDCYTVLKGPGAIQMYPLLNNDKPIFNPSTKIVEVSMEDQTDQIVELRERRRQEGNSFADGLFQIVDGVVSIIGGVAKAIASI